MPGNKEQPLNDNAKSGNNQRPHLNHSTKQCIETFQSNKKKKHQKIGKMIIIGKMTLFRTKIEI
jgi:hypothetical protein